jgi:hypothetical protein
MILHVLKSGGVLLLIVLVAWIGLTVFGPFGERRAAPRVLPVGSAFEGNVQLPRKEIDRQFTAAASRMNTKYDSSETYRTWSEVIDWVSFLCTALITLLAGYFGIQAQSGSPPDIKAIAAGRSAGFARTVGLLAALAAVSTGAGARIKTYSEESYKKATEMRDSLTGLRKNVLEAKDAESARAVLDSVAAVR